MRNGEKIWWCKRVYEENEETPTYEKPQEFILRNPTPFSPIGITCQPKNGFTDYFNYGETTNSDQIIVCQPYLYWKNKFSKGDVFYLDGAKPKSDEENYGETANYSVEFVGMQNEAIVLALEQIRND